MTDLRVEQLRHGRREQDRMNAGSHFLGGFAAGAIVFGTFGIIAGMDAAKAHQTPQTHTVHHEVLIGTGCPKGSGPGSQVATDRFSDPDLEGCKEIEAHDFDEEVR